MPTAPKSRPAKAPRRIVIVDDHPVFREGLVQILNDEKDLVVCGEAGDAAQGLEVITRLQPDLALVDITLPGQSGLQLIKELRALHSAVKVLVVSMHDEAIYAARVLRAGGDGYIMKQEDPEEIVHAMRDVLNGHIYVSEQVAARIEPPPPRRAAKAPAAPIAQLTDRELEVLDLLDRGKTDRDIARQLHVPVGVVATHRARIARKVKGKASREPSRSTSFRRTSAGK